MRCKHCGKKLSYDIHNDSYVIYNGDIYCDEDCMNFDVDYGVPNIETMTEEEWNLHDYWSYDNSSSMTLTDAMNILIRHNKWRRDNHVPNKYEMVNQTELGKAIEIAISSIEKLIDVQENI